MPVFRAAPATAVNSLTNSPSFRQFPSWPILSRLHAGAGRTRAKWAPDCRRRGGRRGARGGRGVPRKEGARWTELRRWVVRPVDRVRRTARHRRRDRARSRRAVRRPGVHRRPAPGRSQDSRAWTWQPCGTIASEAADPGAAFDAAKETSSCSARAACGSMTLSGALRAVSSEPADFLVSAPDGAPLIGMIERSAIVLTPIDSPAARFTFAPSPIAACGKTFAFSVDGDHLFSVGEGTICVSSTSTQAFVGSVAMTHLPAGVFLRPRWSPCGATRSSPSRR